MANYMASLQFPANPNLDDQGNPNEAANRGKALFESDEIGCSDCHIPPLYTDHSKHDVGTGEGSGERKGSEFDVPSLRGIYKTAAYLHDGAWLLLFPLAAFVLWILRRPRTVAA